MRQENRLIYFFWHFLLVGMGSAFLIGFPFIYAFNSAILPEIRLWRIITDTFSLGLMFILPAGTIIGLLSYAMHALITTMKAGVKKTPLVILAFILIAFTLCISQGMMLLLYIPLLFECFILINLEKSWDKPKRKNDL